MNYIKTLIRYKVYFDRSRMYIGYAQFIILLLVLFKSYKDTRFGGWFFDNVIWVFPLFLAVFFGLSIILGFLDKRFIRPHEQKEVTSTNPWIIEILKEVQKTNKKLNEQK